MCIKLKLKSSSTPLLSKMEAELKELVYNLNFLELQSYEIADEKRVMENLIRQKEEYNRNNIKEMEQKIKKLQNELGADVVLSTVEKEHLIKHLVSVDHMLYKLENDESKVILSYEAPSPDDKPYSIHVNLAMKWEPALHIYIKTKSSEVERIVRETLSQYNNMPSHLDPSREEQESFDMNIRREWIKSRHAEKDIHFNHKTIVEV